MKYLFQGLMATWRSLVGRHARYEDLLAYRDRELSRIMRWCVGYHLLRCKLCQRESALIEQDLRTFSRMDRGASDFLDGRKGLGRLRQAIQGWEAQSLVDCAFCKPAYTLNESGLRQLARDLTLYLGNHATASLLLKMRTRRTMHSDLLAEAESVLRDFVGPSAASAVTQRVLYVQMAKERSARDSPAS